MEELPSKEEVAEANNNKNDNLGVQVAMTSSGHYIRQQVRVKVKTPQNSEAFRMRIDLLWAGIDLTNMKYPNHPLLGTSKERVWRDHVNYILGPEVRGLVKQKHGRVNREVPQLGIGALLQPGTFQQSGGANE